METVDCIIIGAGAVGLAIARALALRGRDVLVLEAQAAIGTGISSRNSEVIHAGIYYPAGSLMARLCVEGRKALYEFCRTHGVAFENCGKLIVATSAKEEARLAAIARNAASNGVNDLRYLTGEAAMALEPELYCTSALLSPSTGIFDSHAYMLALRGDAEAAGAVFAFHAPFEGGRAVEKGIIVQVGGSEPLELHCQLLINSAGLAASNLARRIHGLASDFVPRTYFAKGTYFAVAGRAPFSRLIYPLPEPGGLGVHLTFDLNHQMRFGPDVEWIETIDYNVEASRAAVFRTAVRRYWPGLTEDALVPGFCGIRPKIVPPGAPAQDFYVQGPRQHGIPGLINLFGIESPGLTASLALGAYVAGIAAEPFEIRPVEAATFDP
jgi:L-2-hydroxyglutarate oxidase LhgO